MVPGKCEVRGVVLFKSQYSPSAGSLLFSLQKEPNKLSCTPVTLRKMNGHQRGLLACGTE